MELQSLSNHFQSLLLGPDLPLQINKLLTFCYSFSLTEPQVPKRVNSGCYSGMVLLPDETERASLHMCRLVDILKNQGP